MLMSASPTTRPATQRYPQPRFKFPATPPNTAGLDALGGPKERQKEAEVEGEGLLGGSDCTPSHVPPTPARTWRRYLPEGRAATQPLTHRRALSDSTVIDGSSAMRHSHAAGALKIVITKPGGETTRPRTMDDVENARPPFLEISIPTWKIGTPRFTHQGTPVFRESSYAPTEELGASNVSFRTSPQYYFPDGPSSKDHSPARFVGSLLSPPSTEVSGKAMSSVARFSPPTLMRSTYMGARTSIEPSMFDALTFKPPCDDKTIVRYGSSTGAVTAATPARLVAEISSPSFLDYELISDFFLTYRSFLEATDLLRMLIARLRWALSRDDQTGMVVRVRTFVALRHWILNYFVDDFFVDHGLRATFCNLLNDFVEELTQDPRGRKVQLKILAELKKCWRRVCTQYWDGPEFDSSLGPDAPIAPGGIAGHRDSSMDPSFWEQRSDQVQSLDFRQSRQSIRDGSSMKLDASARGAPTDAAVLDNRPSTPEHRDHEDSDGRQTSPTSIMSVDVISCSFPGKNMRVAQPGTMPLGAHPIAANGHHPTTDPVAVTPRALLGKRVRPENPSPHIRNNSLSDSLREHTSAADRLIDKNTELLLSLPYSGSLVRGNVFPPGQPFVDIGSIYPSDNPSRQTTLFQPHPTPPKEKPSPSAMSGQGMKKLLGSVRRALSTRGQRMSPTHGHFLNVSPPGPRGATTNRLPGTAVVPQARPKVITGRPPVRIDILGAEIAEDFKKAVREDAGEGSRSFSSTSGTGTGATHTVGKEPVEVSFAHMDTSFDEDSGNGEQVGTDVQTRPCSGPAMTNGSKSILIVDATASPKVPAMTGALPVVSPSVEAFADTLLRNGADPTPPNTPPSTGNAGALRRSSYVLGGHVLRPSSSSDDPLPPFIPDLETLGGRQSEDDVSGPSTDHAARHLRPPPVSWVRGHVRQRSSWTHRSNQSIGRHRYKSCHSAIAARFAARSLDFTTYSAGSLTSMSDIPALEPLRVLRRRPGGDLRAVQNVGDLDHGSLRRSQSVGSLTSYSESIKSSYLRSQGVNTSLMEAMSPGASHETNPTFSLGAMAEAQKNRHISLLSTHSSKPARPSFELCAQELREIPDDTEDDGGVESALLKLEGKFPKKKPRKLSSAARNTLGIPSNSNSSDHTTKPGREPPREVKAEHRHLHIASEGLFPPDQAVEEASSLNVTDARKSQVESFLSEDSQASYNSIPLLERGLTDDGRSKNETGEWTSTSVPRAPDEETSGTGAAEHETPGRSSQNKTQAEGPSRGADGVGKGRSTEQHSTQSFLDTEDSDKDSGLSSEFSTDSDELDRSATEQNAFLPLGVSAVVSRLPTHPLGDPASPPRQAQAPSPPMTLVQALRMSPESAKIPRLHDHQLRTQKPLPPTPDITPINVAYKLPSQPSQDVTRTAEASRGASKSSGNAAMRGKFSVHLPFILAFDSDILAQQFTLIEKDALNEIDWRELIDMKWKNASNNDSRSWVDFLRNTDARGVEVVIARFNIMVKWAVSEIVLTQDVEERARCIIKFIHIARNCRRYRNFATTSQITIALTSNDVSRLSNTWELIPPQDVRTLHELEALISPTRNFYNLRSEMEGGGGAGADGCEVGCIPFVGIYTHDLLYNSQRPSEIASSPTTPPLVNFERCRMAAGIVKTLLRLLEASTHYAFQPIEGITERCLWMSALTDDEIRRHSESLEQGTYSDTTPQSSRLK